MQQKERINLRGSLVNLTPGETLVVSLEDFAYTTIRSYVVELGWSMQRKYTCKRNREARTYTVTRLS